MKAYVEKEECTGCGNCEQICPQVFEMNDEGVADVIAEELDVETLKCAKEAVEDCPVDCIELK